MLVKKGEKNYVITNSFNKYDYNSQSDSNISVKEIFLD